jgi:hypothetical protein
VDGDHAVLRSVALDDHDSARLDHEEVVARVPLAEEDLAGVDHAEPARRAQARALIGIQPWKGAVPVGRLLKPRPRRRLAHCGLASMRSGRSTRTWSRCVQVGISRPPGRPRAG